MELGSSGTAQGGYCLLLISSLGDLGEVRAKSWSVELSFGDIVALEKAIFPESG